MKLNRQNFVSVLEKVRPALGDGKFIPDLAFFKIKGGRVQAYDGCIVIDALLPENTELDLAVPGEPFLKLLQSLTEDEIELTKGKGEVKVLTDELKGTFVCLENINMKDIVEGKIITNSSECIKDIIEGLLTCRIAVNKDQTSGPLQGVMVNEDKLLGSDRYRIMLWKLDNKHPDFICSIPPKFIDVISKYKNEVTELSFSKEDGLVARLEDETYISTSLLEGEMRDLLQYFSIDSKFEEVEFSGKIVPAIDRHVDFLYRVDTIDKEVDVSISGNKCKLESKDEELGSLSEEVEITNPSSCEFQFRVNPVFLKGVVGKYPIMRYYKEKGTILLGDEKVKYLTTDREE